MSSPREVIDTVFPRVLEEMGFLFADPSDVNSLPGAPYDAVKVSMSFAGAKRGSIALAISQGLGAEMAANLLDIDPEEAGATQAGQDALRELLNVTCGHVLTELAGEEVVFDLTIPKIDAIDHTAWKALGAMDETAAFSVDGRPVLISMIVES